LHPKRGEPTREGEREKREWRRRAFKWNTTGRGWKSEGRSPKSEVEIAGGVWVLRLVRTISTIVVEGIMARYRIDWPEGSGLRILPVDEIDDGLWPR
jgi:hypothetical protein